MVSRRTILGLHELGERTLPSASVAVPTLVPHAPAVVSAAATTPHPLIGLGSAPYHGTTATADTGMSITLRGLVTLDGLGVFHVKGPVQGVGNIASGRAMGTLTLTNSHGSITVALHGPEQAAFSKLPAELVYSITSGTGQYQSLRGYGTVALKLIPAPIAVGQPPAGNVTLKFS